ncbi:uncharacterized protein [Epargyreus clarus]|uniref:uncharacterized protein n=1 Tax=Epargyreus clarus TaxID=520877 RepID=UPI003C2DC0EF
MKGARVVNVKARDIRSTYNGAYDLYSSRIVKIQRDYIQSYRSTRNASCQCNIRKDCICTCKKLASVEPRYYSFPKQVYRYTDWRNFTDIGVGSIKALPRKRIRKIYLPETVDKAVGSADLTSYINRRSKQRREDSYYDNKRTSSKCVGGVIENDNIPLISKQLSPMIQKKSGATSPKSEVSKEQNKNIESRNEQKQSTTPTQVGTNDTVPMEPPKELSHNSKIKPNSTSKNNMQTEIVPTDAPPADDKVKSLVVNNNETKDFSSDSFVQHVHNLENPSYEKQSKMSVDPMENKLEREYRKMFSSKSKDRPSADKPIPDFKSASLLRRRFEALRRGLGKKESKRESGLINKPSSHTSVVPSRKDVSIASDPPSLEGRSYSNTKVYSPFPSTTHDYKVYPKVSHRKSPKTKGNTIQWPTDTLDSKFESVQGMFKLWGKKFNLDEDVCKTSPTISNNVSASPENELKLEFPPQDAVAKKKQGKRFFFFGKKDKNKENKPYKPKKGVTTGRCEVKDGLVIKVGGASEPVKEPVKKPDKHVEEYNVLRKAWLERFITTAGDSRNSVHIRWNNNMYATSSSTVLELMDSVYKHTGIGFRSRSEITTAESSNYRSFTKQRVHFVQQDIEAWMIPKMITDKNQGIETRDKNIPMKISNHKWFVDAPKGFSQKIELVLHAKPNSSSEYIIINIPEGYFSKSSSYETRIQSSDEKIYKIVEYDTSDLKKIKENRHMATGDNLVNSTKVTVSIQNNGDKEDKESKISDSILKRPLLLRDVAIQGSTVFVPKRCDVIGVGIITQRDIRDVRNPILKLEDDLTDDSEGNLSIKKCELAESYLQDYCQNWMPSGIDTFSWQISDSQLHSSENNSVATLSQGDGSKSCPNMFDDFQGSTVVLSSCETSSCSHCIAIEDEKKPDDSLKCKFFKKFKKKSSSEAPMNDEKRYFPKDSVEVLKKRQLYAYTNQKSKWRSADGLNLSSSTKIQRSSTNSPKTKPCWKSPDAFKKGKCRNKHVSLPGCEAMSRVNDRLSDRSLEGILSYKGSACNPRGQSPKRAGVIPKPVCEIPQPPCKESCVQEKKPACTKKDATPCDQIFQDQMCPEKLPPCERILIKRPCDAPPICVKPPKPVRCTSPCRDTYIPPCKKQPSNDDCRPRLSRTPSQQSGLNLKMAPSPKSSQSCIKKPSNTNCKPMCVNRPVRAMTPPPPPPPPSMDCSDSKKLSGLYLKKLPSKKKTNCGVCPSCESDGPGVIRLNSQERITIRMKRETPSTEEIREGLNIKVQDEDGQTLYERIDYKQSGDVNKCVLLKDMYKDPVIRRVSTPTTVHDVIAQNNPNEIHETKSDNDSVDNLIEINFTLKLKKGDRGTEFNIKNAGDTDIKQKPVEQGTEAPKDIYIVQDRADPPPEASNKKDVNIKIVIKNYNTDPDKNNETENMAVLRHNDNFTNRISEKFQTVSTGYSDIMDQHTFSIHRTTVDLTTSTETCKMENKPSDCKGSNHIKEGETKKIISSSHSVTEPNRSVTEQTVNLLKYDNKEENSIVSAKNSFTIHAGNSTEVSHEDTDHFDDYKSDKYSSKEKDKHTDVAETSNESILHKKLHLRNKTQKKKMLKKLFQTSSVIKKPENKKKIKEIIKAILTSDSSVNEDITLTNNELAKEITYDSLGPTFFRDTDSMNNYYQRDSDLSVYKTSTHKKLNPTKNNSECSGNDTDISIEKVKRKCMCSTLATKLNLTQNGGGGCCCRKTVQKNVEIDCSLENGDYLSNLKSYIDVDTQNSIHVSNKINSANLIRSNTKSVVITNTSVTVKKSIDMNYGTTKNKCFKTLLPDVNIIKSGGMKRFNRETITGLSEDEILVVNSNLVANSISKCYRNKLLKKKDSSHAAADILQLNETKKAVLEIYAEKIVSDEGERIVAKLPKFDIEKENDISSYEGIVAGRRKISNFVMMSINR